MTLQKYIVQLPLVMMIFFICVNVQGQVISKLDSLNNALKTAKEDSNKVNIYLGIARQQFGSDLDATSEYGHKALKLARKIKFSSGEAESCNVLGVYNYVVGNLDSSEYYYLRALDIANKNNLKKIKIKCYGNIGLVYTNQGKYDKAIQYLNKSLKLNEQAGDSASIARNCADIASIYSYSNKYDLSIQYNTRALDLFRKLGIKQGEGNVLNSIGSLYYDIKKYNEAIVYFNRSIKIKESIGDLKGLSNTYHNLSMLLQDVNKIDSAKIILEKSLKINFQIENKEGIANDYISMGVLSYGEGNVKKAVEYYELAYSLSEKMGFLLQKKTSAMNLANCYDTLGDYKNALLYYRKYKVLSDSLKSVEIEKKVTEVEELYQNEKKQKEIELLEKDKALQKTEMVRQKTQKYAFIVGFILMLVIAFLAIISYRKIRRQKNVIEEKNCELNQQNEEIRTQRDEIEAQRDVVTNQRDHIEEQKKEITDSITYAKRIQNAILPDLSQLFGDSTGGNAFSVKTGDHFVLFRPKDIVSGDFYWGTRVNEWLIFTVADCTGHGVPGAFMSMLGVSFLNEIVRKKEVTKASDVLNHLRASVIDAIQQKARSGEQQEMPSSSLSEVKDGMDIALCVLNTETNVLQFAGANNPLYIVSGSGLRVSAEVNQKPGTRN